MTTHSQPPTATDVPCRPAWDRATALRLAGTEYGRVTDLLASLTPEQWRADTDCTGWDVRALAGHVLGMVQMVRSVPALVRQQAAAARRVKRDGGPPIHALTALQVEWNASLTPQQVVAELRRLAPRALRTRRRVPGVLLGRTMDEETDGLWTVGYLVDVILTRDPFMHRIDIARATGLPVSATADHEGVVVADVVREWSERHGRPFELVLAGPAGGRWQVGEGGEHLEMDAFEFCRALSGRAPAPGLLATQVPF
jgi:uncharacterized protein (TIGR03083 family)